MYRIEDFLGTYVHFAGVVQNKHVEANNLKVVAVKGALNRHPKIHCKGKYKTWSTFEFNPGQASKLLLERRILFGDLTLRMTFKPV